MNPVIAAITQRARTQAHSPALESEGRIISYGELNIAIQEAAQILSLKKISRLGIAMDNSPAWVIWDLAALLAGVTTIPLSGFFSAGQRQHAIQDAGIEAIVDDKGKDYEIGGYAVGWQDLAVTYPRSLPDGTVKITYTSGTSGTPKGVCLSQEAISRVAESLVHATDANSNDRHLSLLPLSVLLENIAGLYVPLMAGACSVLEPLRSIGLNGSSQLETGHLKHALDRTRASSCIMVPALLEAFCKEHADGTPPPSYLRFLAIGGSKVSTSLIRRAQEIGLPIYQGYGLSECASVVSLNTPQDNDPFSVGRPLPHVDLKIAEDGEILIKDPGFLAYLNHGNSVEGWWPTGDLGHFDTHGRLHIHGRKKDIFVTAFGRNVSPEWIEVELMAEPEIIQAAVYGEARPFNLAVIYTLSSDEYIDACITRVNQRLPDYAHIGGWIRAKQAFRPENGMLRANGGLHRAFIISHYREEIETLYMEAQHT